MLAKLQIAEYFAKTYQIYVCRDGVGYSQLITTLFDTHLNFLCNTNKVYVLYLGGTMNIGYKFQIISYP